MKPDFLAQVNATCAGIPAAIATGHITSLSGLAVTVAGLGSLASVGDRVSLMRRNGASIPAEIIGFSASHAHAMAFGSLDGLASGNEVRFPVFLGSRTPKPGEAFLFQTDGSGGSLIRSDVLSTARGHCHRGL